MPTRKCQPAVKVKAVAQRANPSPARRELPVAMLGFVVSVRRSESMGEDGRPLQAAHLLSADANLPGSA